MRDAEAYQDKVYSKDDLILMLSRIRRKPLSDPTFYRWLGINGITPKVEYSYEESQKLVTTCRHFQRNGKLKDLLQGRTLK